MDKEGDRLQRHCIRAYLFSEITELMACQIEICKSLNMGFNSTINTFLFTVLRKVPLYYSLYICGEITRKEWQYWLERDFRIHFREYAGDPGKFFTATGLDVPPTPEKARKLSSLIFTYAKPVFLSIENAEELRLLLYAAQQLGEKYKMLARQILMDKDKRSDIIRKVYAEQKTKERYQQLLSVLTDPELQMSILKIMEFQVPIPATLPKLTDAQQQKIRKAVDELIARKIKEIYHTRL